MFLSRTREGSRNTRMGVGAVTVFFGLVLRLPDFDLAGLSGDKMTELLTVK